MIALDIGDKIKGDASTDAVVDCTLHGTDANVIKQLAASQLSDTPASDLYTADSVDAVTGILLVNTHSSAVAVNLFLTPSGGSDYRIIPKDLSLGIGYSLYTDGKNINVMDASGNVLTTATVLSHALGGSSHDADTLANLSTKVSDDGVVGLAATQELTNKTLNASVLKGTFTASGTVVLPAFTLGGTLDANGNYLANVARLYPSISDSLFIYGKRQDHDTSIRITTPGAPAGYADTTRCIFEGRAAETAVAWQNCNHTGFKLGGALTLNGQVFDAGSGEAQINTTGAGIGLRVTTAAVGNVGAAMLLYHNSASPADNDDIGYFAFSANTLASNGFPADTNVQYARIFVRALDVTDETEDAQMIWTLRDDGVFNQNMVLSGAGELWTDLGFDADEYFKVAGTQVVGARVVDARISNTPNSGDGDTDALIDAMRDALLSHGLMAAS